jgi:cellulose synthase/poly-beta-1,6-N-acetylglucosamine synthase-like glycosyltransferase/peptidoglycan/xylan/chitin deacetylase (PgdA/CDA1 family)/spore germination protein YaaH
MTNTTTPIFFDPSARRWWRFKRIAQGVAAVLSGIFAILIISITINPALPSIGLPPARVFPQVHHLAPPQPTRFLNRSDRRFERTKRKLRTALTGPVTTKARTETSARSVSTSPSTLIGFYVNWDDTSFTSLKQNLNQLDVLMPEWLHLTSADGTVASDDPGKQAQVLAYLHDRRPQLPIVPLINNFSATQMDWDGKGLAAMLANAAARARVITALLQFVHDNGCAGVNIDFEAIPDSAQGNLKTFMRELFTQFHPAGLEVSQSVPFDDPAFDYRGLAAWTDYFVLMAYDEHWSSSRPGAIASQSWYQAALRRRFAELPAQHYVVAVGNYGYDWQPHTPNANEISFQDALTIAQESEGHITLEPRTLNPTFDYYDEHDVLHHVWFLDGVTTFNQLVATQRYQPRGIALWRLGSEDPSIWSVFAHRSQLNLQTADSLQLLHYGYDLDYEGKGEVLKLTATPKDGTRQIAYENTTGLITAEQFSTYPSPYVIQRWGGNTSKQIALTFDDGPDAQYTPQILDILQRYHVPATFFIVGLNGELNTALLRRIVAEGHEIGNHTFTHPDISTISVQQLRLELNATERLLESRLGLRSVLFRPPYAEDIEPETPDQVRPLQLASTIGYYTIGMQIDPNDWRNPGVAQIVKNTLDGATNGEGSIVLLHDSGGDRSQTVNALPQIIEGLQEQGFTLVPISTLLGVSHETVMPPLPHEERTTARVMELGFLLINWANILLHYLFMIGIVLGALRVLFIGSLALGSRWRRPLAFSGTNHSTPTVSVIVPAYNEEQVICQTIHSLLLSDYPTFDIIVVDDGSLDHTVQRVQAQFGNHPQVRLLTKENGGKAQALNYGIQHTTAEIVVTLDADTLFTPTTIRLLARHFANPHIGAVAGNAKVGNRLNLLTKWQALEYITSQNLDRRAFAALNCVTVVPGAVGAWRRDVIVQAGGFSDATLAEDADLTLAILRQHYQVAYEEQALAFTEAPDTVRNFLKQRFRWMYGTLQAAWKHRDTMLRPRYGALGMWAIPNILLFQVLFPLLSPVMDMLLAWSLASTAWQRYQHPLDYSSDTLERVLYYYALFMMLDLLAALMAFILERSEEWQLLIWLFLQRFFYRQLMYYVAIKSTLTAIRGTLVGWGKLERKATVTVKESFGI